MKYSSTRGKDRSVSFENVLLNGLANDGGLYVPNRIPKLDKHEILKLNGLEYYELAYKITYNYVSSCIPKKDYFKICKKSYENFSKNEIISLSKLKKKEYILNLYHGPTLAFKDYALQLLGNIYDYVLKKNNKKLTIIGATSGDTGSAAIAGCSNSEMVKMFILFPLNKVSEIQRRQMTTINKKNVCNIAIKGNFDDCQNIVKSLFERNNKKKNKINLAAVNSINWVRIMGQIVYYFWAYLKCAKDYEKIIYSIPTGNFGNVYAGYIAKKMGLPIKKLLVASNSNDVLTRFFETGVMKKRKTIKTISPSMDIQVSSNFERLMYDYLKKDTRLVNKYFFNLNTKDIFTIDKVKLEKMLKLFQGFRLSDKETKECIKIIYKDHNIVIDPHTAVGIEAGRKNRNDKELNVYLSTAHHGKFIDTVNNSLNENIKLPKKLRDILKKNEFYEVLDNNLLDLEKYIISKN
jgi:threonine synthase